AERETRPRASRPPPRGAAPPRPRRRPAAAARARACRTVLRPPVPDRPAAVTDKTLPCRFPLRVPGEYRRPANRGGKRTGVADGRIGGPAGTIVTDCRRLVRAEWLQKGTRSTKRKPRDET